MKATAVAPANIAFIKYWGKVDPLTRVPRNNSISMDLSEMYTTTTVEFLPELKEDHVRFINEETVTKREMERIVEALDKIRGVSKTQMFANVVTKNTFPKAAGIASSASGFASLAVAAFGALTYPMKEKGLSLFCRLLSGTACRSIPDGFVEWERGTSTDTSYAHQLYPPEYWNICDVIVIVSKSMKKVGSTEGHAIADTSPFYEDRMLKLDNKIKAIKESMQKKDFTAFGKIVEEEALNMHAICLTSRPPLIYWEPTTIDIMKHVQMWREEQNVESYFTIDAGPTVHIICQEKDNEQVIKLAKTIKGIKEITMNRPSEGAHIINEHLF